MEWNCFRRSRWSLVGWISLVAAVSVAGQGTMQFNRTVLVTGSGPALITDSRTFQTTINFSEVRLSLEVGFSTEEISQPGSFADSFSVTLTPTSGSLSPILFFTMDVNGVVWAPPTPGTFPISSDSIVRTPITTPSFTPDLPNRIAYQIEAPIPSAYAGQPLTLHFDLFDNGSVPRSLGWFGEPVVVPEPATWALLALGSSVLLFIRKMRR